MQELYDRYSKGLRRCVDRVYADGSDADLADRFRANVSRFAAYKADYVKTTVSNILNDASIPLKQRQEMADAAVAGFDRYSEAECNTATSRCRTAKQWKEFSDPQRLRLFPNLRWLPSRSAVIRATHEKFYDKVWPKGDDFWNTNMPGQEWNCKCDLEETDDPVTDNSDVKTVPVPKGLEGNPSVTGEIFTDKASYISSCSNRKKEKIEKWYGDKILRKTTRNNMKVYQGQTIVVDKMGENIDVIFDSKTTGHFCNDAAQSSHPVWCEFSDRMPQILTNSKLVAHEMNTKLDKKPWAVEYFYYEYKTPYDTIFLSVEYNDIIPEGRKFYRLYAITDKLRSTAIIYKKKNH